ncbi:MAG: extracellular solute-binding protein, partial [Gemmatimonadota bacterium]|nr:extracellular solute-binding protein [Gemmatimonadota bacterium]
MKNHSRILLLLGVLVAFALAAGACGDDGDEPSTSPATTVESSAEEAVAESTEPAETDATAEPDEPAETGETAEPDEPSEPDQPSEPAETAAPELTSEPVTLRVLMESGGGAFDLLANLGDEFSRQYPNVTFEYQKDSFDNLIINGPRLLASDDPPDIILLPQLLQPATEGLIASLDGYFEQYGWDAWSASQLAQNRVTAEGIRGSGTMYG